MGFYDDTTNVKEYLKMCEGYDGQALYTELAKYLKEGSSLLELGCGGGADAVSLNKRYNYTGSDLSDAFLEVCHKEYSDINFIKMDVLKLSLDKHYDAVFSNKVLHHLNHEELKTTLKQQVKLLSDDGIIAHSFWLGDEDKEMFDMLFTYYKKEVLLEIISEHFNVLSTYLYKEFQADDSLFIIAKVKSI